MSFPPLYNNTLNQKNSQKNDYFLGFDGWQIVYLFYNQYFPTN